MALQTTASRIEPGYYHREYKHDVFDLKFQDSWAEPSKRIGFVALPFISLYKPLSFPLSLAMGGLRTVNSATHLLEEIAKGDPKDISLAVLQTGIAVIALASTFFAHPLGMFASTAQDLVMELNDLMQNLTSDNCDYEKAIGSCLNIIHHALYLSLFFRGGLELSIASLAMQIVVGLYHSQAEFRAGNRLEGTGHLLMSVVRGYQLKGQVSLLQTKWKLEEERQVVTLVSLNSPEGMKRLQDSYHTPLLPLKNSYEAQRKNYCGVASSVMVLKALGSSYSQDTFFTEPVQAITSPETVSNRGFNFEELLGCLNTFPDFKAKEIYGSEFSTPEELGGALKQLMSANNLYVIANFHRKVLGQAGGGHYSPLAAYDEKSRSVLILDVNPRYKQGYWVDLDHFFMSIQNINDQRNLLRGLLLCSEF